MMATRLARVVARLRHPAPHHALDQAFRYAAVGACGYVLAMASYAGELAVGVPPYPAIVVVFVLNGVFNFVGIRVWAFPPSGRSVSSEGGRFIAVAALSLAVNYATFALLYSVIGLPALAAQALTVAAVAPVGFLANRYWSFSSSERAGGLRRRMRA